MTPFEAAGGLSVGERCWCHAKIMGSAEIRLLIFI